jgi:hypothetical protein
VLQQIAVALREHHAQIHRKAAVGPGHELGQAAFLHRGDLGECGEGVHDELRFGGRCNQVDIPYGRPAPPEASREVGLVYLGKHAQCRREAFRSGLDRPDEMTIGARLGGGKSAEQIRLGLGAHARQSADTALLGRLSERMQVVDTEGRPELPCLLGTHPGYAHEIEHALGIRCPQLLEHRNGAGVEVFGHLALYCRADSRQRAELSPQGQLRDRCRVPLERLGGLLVGERAVH